jgi:hypothetical protein
MGRWSYSNKTEADYLKKVEIWWLKKYGYLNGWKSGGIKWNSGAGNESSIGFIVSTGDGENDNYIRFQYTQTENNGEKKEFNYEVKLTTTPCNYGGARYWFICPLVVNGQRCGRCVGVLYKGGDYFGCRHCYDLTYSSKKHNRKYKNYSLFHALDLMTKSELIQRKMKRGFYAGKPTKNLKKIEKITNQLSTINRLGLIK